MGNRTLKGHRRNQWGSDNSEVDFVSDPKIAGSEQKTNTENTGTSTTEGDDKELSPSKLWATAKKKKIFKGNFACFCTAFNKNPELAEDAVLQEKEFFINAEGNIETIEPVTETENAEGVASEGKIGPPKTTPAPTTPVVTSLATKTNYTPIIITGLVITTAVVAYICYNKYYKNKTNV